MTGWAIVASMVVTNSSGMVLCIGHDGHLAVEPVHEDHCDHPLEENSHAHEAITITVAFPDECDDDTCFDVSLDLDKVAPARKELRHNLFPKPVAAKHFAASYMVESMLERDGAHSLCNKAPPILVHTLLAHRTTVLQL